MATSIKRKGGQICAMHIPIGELCDDDTILAMEAWNFL